MALPLRATLDLGEVELSLDELLALRPGSTVSFARPALLQGAIRVQGGLWALVDIECKEDEISLRVRELTSLPG
jgi:flagellar motor switch/type III secretory pathway protein FliN